MTQTIGKSSLSPQAVLQAAAQAPTPFYIYDQNFIIERCRQFMAMPNAYGIRPRFAMKANSSRALLQLISAQGLNIDASSFNEAKRAIMAGIVPERVLLTTQEVPADGEREELEALMQKGLKYNACSLTQLALILPFAARSGISLAMRVHPGVGSGESVTRNTGDKYSCFGIHLSDLEKAMALAAEHKVKIDLVHVHIGSGGDPRAWQDNITRELAFIERYFPDAQTVNFGGGFKEARVSDETPADIQALGLAAKNEVEAFYQRTGRRLLTEVEPGNYIIANAGTLVTRVIDSKQTGPDGFRFIIVNGGMETITRPLLYGSRHPFAVLGPEGQIRWDDSANLPGDDSANVPDDNSSASTDFGSAPEELIIVGRCCESGDSLTLNPDHSIAPRALLKPEIGDYLLVGGAGAYCASMSPFNYNSHNQAAEFLQRQDGIVQLIRKRQSLEQIIQNESSLDE